MKDMYTIKAAGSNEVLGAYSTEENATETAAELHDITGIIFTITHGRIHESVTLDDEIDEDIFDD